MFVDQVSVSGQAGDGGDGCSSFLREKFVPLGGPDGGDGGRGGNLVLETDSNLTTLESFKYRQIRRAESGKPGRGKQMTGKSGKDCLLKVPLGTLVKDSITGDILFDLKEKGQRFILAHGGRGGQGNARFKTSVNRAPRKFQPGEPGEAKTVILELKLLADVGIIGFPNAGKSTLISRISNARPKIADYPFSTLIPNLGVVTLDDYFSFVVADIPGLVEGAHQGKGLGIQFLRHIERTRLLVHLLDFSLECDRDPIKDFHAIQNELQSFNEDLFQKPQILVANKIDHPEAKEKLEKYRAEIKNLNSEMLEVSSVTGDGISGLLSLLRNKLSQLEA